MGCKYTWNLYKPSKQKNLFMAFMVTMPTLFVHASMKPVVNSWRGC